MKLKCITQCPRNSNIKYTPVRETSQKYPRRHVQECSLKPCTCHRKKVRKNPSDSPKGKDKFIF